MSYDPKLQTQSYAAGGQAVDAGLQSYMRGVYNTMGLGLVVTGLVAFAVASIPALSQAIFTTPLRFVFMFAPLAFLWFGFTPARIARFSVDKLRSLFFLFSGLMGVSLATIFLIYTGDSIARVFFITSATFAAVSIYGYTTKRDLTGLGSFMFMGLIGIFIAAIVNLFLQSAMIHFVVSMIGVIVFTGLTAWETQRLKETYSYAHGAAEANGKLAVMGALSLYLNFINLFQSLMALLGNRE